MVAMGRGTRNWLLQRATAIVLLAYVIVMAVFLATCAPLTYAHWSLLVAHPAFRVLSLMVCVCFSLHAWIGLWSVLTDYVKCPRLRLLLEFIVLLVLLALLCWGVDVIFCVHAR